MYPQTVQLLINNRWRAPDGDDCIPVINPATEAVLGVVAKASHDDIAEAVAAAESGFAVWSATSAYDRSRVLRRAADLLRERAESIAQLLTAEQGKPLAEARTEIVNAADILDWFAEEGRRTYGRIIPARAPQIRQNVTLHPVGPVAAFTPWNFPINQASRKIGAALAAGCSIVLKGPEEAPAACAALVGALLDAGLPPSVVNLVFGDPARISDQLIRHPAIRKVSFTGSTAVGKTLAALAGAQMKLMTMELGGHAPALIFDDADVEDAAVKLAAAKFRNAGQICVAPSRFLVHVKVYERFMSAFLAQVDRIKVGDGTVAGTTMGPLANRRRLDALLDLVGDAKANGAQVITGGHRIGNQGFFFAPTVTADAPRAARLLHEEPFGPIAVINRFKDDAEALAEANRLPFGLASYAFTHNASRIAVLSDRIEAGMLAVNHTAIAIPELPFGGVKESGFGSEGGSEAIRHYLTPKSVTTLLPQAAPS